MDYRKRKTLQKQNSERLRDLGLPSDLFSEGFQEREAAAKRLELLLVVEFERRWRSGEWDHLSLPFDQIIERWSADIARPMHFASIGAQPRWKTALTTAGEEWRRISSGKQRLAWREYRRKQITTKRAAQGKPPSKWKV
jgi:hypothetical protein